MTLSILTITVNFTLTPEAIEALGKKTKEAIVSGYCTPFRSPLTASGEVYCFDTPLEQLQPEQYGIELPERYSIELPEKAEVR